jgi:hypothetical protein
MRSAVVAGLLVLAGCGAKKDANLLETVSKEDPAPTASEAIVDAGGSPSDRTPPQPPLPPTLPGDLTKVPISIPAKNLVKGKHYQAQGVEPFWALDVLPDKLIYTTPEIQPGLSVPYKSSREGARTRYSGTLQGKPMILTIEPGTCNDGMSDIVYAYKASFTLGDRTERGCAELK